MAKNTEARPEWFKFWRRNRRQLDIEQLDMKSRGIIFTNMMRYFDGDDSELLEMSPLECMAFNVLKINVDDTFSEYATTSAQNRANANKRWQRSNADEYDRMRAHANHAEDRSQKTEDRMRSPVTRAPHSYFLLLTSYFLLLTSYFCLLFLLPNLKPIRVIHLRIVVDHLQFDEVVVLEVDVRDVVEVHEIAVDGAA